MSLGLLDLIGVALLGSVATLTFKLVTGDTSPTKLELILQKHLSVNYSTTTLVLLFISTATFFLVLKSVLQIFLNYKLAKYLAGAETRLASKVFKSIIGKNVSEINSNNYSYYQSALTQGVNKIIIGIISSTILFFTDLITTLLMLSFAFYASFVSTLVIVIILFISYFVFNGPINKRAKVYGKASYKSNSIVNEGLLEVFRGMREIKAYGVEEKYQEDFTIAKYETSLVGQKITWLNSLIRYFLEISILLSGTIVIFLLIITTDVRHGVTTAAVLIVVGYRLIPNIQRLQNGINSIRVAEGWVKPIFELLNNDNSKITKNSLKMKNTDSTISKIEVSELSFEFANKNKVINNLSFEFEGNQTLSIIGDSGSGKSTLIDLLSGLYVPSSGTIKYLDYMTGTELKISDFKIGYISQSCPLFGNDIFQNISLTSNCNELEKEKIKTIVENLGLNYFINKENGQSKNVRSDGTNISGGERQRLSIARAIYQNPEIILLDEPTSALDSENVNKVKEYLKSINHKKTIILVTHDVDLIKVSDYVLYLDKGTSLFFGKVKDYFAWTA